VIFLLIKLFFFMNAFPSFDSGVSKHL